MGGEIAQVRDNVTALANTIASTSANYRFALVDYKDGPDQGDPYRAQVDLNFTTDVASFANAVSTLSASGGGDYPESVYSGVMTALGLPWRTGVRKIVIVIGDAPGKDPEPQTNYTLDTVRQKALAVDPAQVYTVALTSEPTANTFMQNLANATGGQFVSQPDLSNFVPTLESTIIKAGSAPLADAGGPYSGIINDPVTFSAGGSRDDSEKIIKYDWDFNGDGVYDATTDNPVTSYAYSSTGKYNLTVRVRSASGLAATATSTVTITAAPSIPSAPISLTATASDSAITLTWANASGGGQPQWYTITDATGSVIDRVSAQADGSPPSAWVDTDLTNGVAYSYKVSAGNAAGESPAAGPVTATPHVANQPPTANPDSYSTDNQTQLVIPVPGVLANDLDPDPGDTITAHLISSTLNGSLSLQSDGSFTYTPKTNFVGTDKFTYQAVDSQGATSTPTEVDITVTKPTKHTHQHVVFIASTKPPVILVDWLVNGGYIISTTQNQVDLISGTGDFTFGRDKNSSLTMSVQKSGNQWDGTFTITSLKSKSVLTGHGIIRHVGHIIIGTFSGDGYRISFIISG